MNIFDVLKRKHEQQKDQKLQMPDVKKSLNTDVNPGLIGKLKKLKAEFSVPQYAIVEHVLEVGHFYVSKVSKNPKKKELLREHLIDKHMLNTGFRDPEELLRLGEGRYSSELIFRAKGLMRDLWALGRIAENAQRTGNFSYVNKAYEGLMKSALLFVDWLSKHPLDEENEEEAN